MNREEQLAKAYLESLKSGDVMFEPLGDKKLPDFSLAARIGVEVRRLNENYFGGERTEGLEQADRPLWKALNETLASFEGVSSSRSYWVMIEFERPVDLKGKKLREGIRGALDGFLGSARADSIGPTSLDVREGLRLWLHPSAIVTGNPFRVMGSSDGDSGGMVSQLYAQNIEHCIEDKSRKVIPVRDQFEEWWLMLVDNLHYGLPDYEVAEVEQAVNELGPFNRLILLDHDGRAPLLDLAAAF